MKHMKKVDTANIANFTLSLITAFELLQKVRLFCCSLYYK